MQRLGGLCGYRFVVLVELDVQQLEGLVVTVCSPRQHEKEKPIMILLTMYISFSMLEPQQACTARFMSSPGSGSV